MSTRPPEPEFLIQWRDWMRAGPPKCCHTCDYFDEHGHCTSYDMTPPAEFCDTVDACGRWVYAIPF